MAGQVGLADVFAMLDECAKGHEKTLGDHYWCVRYNQLEYPTLPTGSKGDKRKLVQIMKVRKMVQVLKIDRACARKSIPALVNVLKDQTAEPPTTSEE